MPKGMKTCPKCQSVTAPATKICSTCSYVFSKKSKSPYKLTKQSVKRLNTPVVDNDSLVERVNLLESQVANLMNLLCVASPGVNLSELDNSVINVAETIDSDDVVSFDTEDVDDDEVIDLDFSANLFDSA